MSLKDLPFVFKLTLNVPFSIAAPALFSTPNKTLNCS